MGVEADWDQQAPDVQSELHQAPLRSCLPQKELETFPSSGTTWTHTTGLGGEKKDISWSVLMILKPEMNHQNAGWWREEP